MNKHLEASIKHWERVVEDPDEPVGRTHCALCMEYNNNSLGDVKYDCIECPVMIRTGSQFCFDTPWMKYDKCAHNEQEPEREQLAQAELDFLISLREE